MQIDLYFFQRNNNKCVRGLRVQDYNCIRKMIELYFNL